MFAKELDSLSLASDIADELFPNITGAMYGRDQTFIATLRALLHSRITPEDRVRMYYTSKRATVRDTERFGKKGSKYLKYCFEGLDTLADEASTGILHVHSVRATTEEDLKAGFEYVDNDTTLTEQGYELMADLQHFMEQPKIKIPARFYIHKERRNTVVVVANIDIKRWHFIQAMIPRYFPWFFAEKPIAEEDAALIKSLNNRYAPDYENAIENFAKKFDFRAAKLRKILKDFETGLDRGKLDQVRREIRNLKTKIEEYERCISDYFVRMDGFRVEEVGLQARIAQHKPDEESEMMQFFMCNKGLHLVNADFTNFEFIVATTISNYDPDLFEKLIRKKPTSAFYRHYENGRAYENKEMTDDRIELLMRAILGEERLKLRVCAAYRMDFRTASVRALSGYDYSYNMPHYKDYTPNQHIHHYACLGNNDGTIRRSLRDHDYVAAIVACMSSAKNMNLTESNTITWFMQEIMRPTVGRIIEMPDGSIMTPLDAAKWLEEEKNGKRKEEEAHE